MILRSVMRHVHEQNWIAVGLDFMIVVVGVFIGIQVANWNDRLADERLGEDYRVRLIADLERDLESAHTLSVYYSAVMDSVLETQALLDEASPDPEALIISAYRATEVNYNPQSRATWQQVVSSGDIALLPEAATPLIAEYFAYDYVRDTHEQLLDSTYREHLRSLIPIEIQQMIQRSCSDERTRTGVVTGFQADCSLEIEAETARRTTERLRLDEKLRSSLKYQYSLVFNAGVNTEGLAVLISDALEALQGPASLSREGEIQP